MRQPGYFPSADDALYPSAPSVNDDSGQSVIDFDRGPMKLIPWEDIWHSLRDARIRGHGQMIEVFYETLFKEAVFDDAGAWSQAQSKRN